MKLKGEILHDKIDLVRVSRKHFIDNRMKAGRVRALNIYKFHNSNRGRRLPLDRRMGCVQLIDFIIIFLRTLLRGRLLLGDLASGRQSLNYIS